MNIQSEKLELVQAILNIEDVNVIQSLKEVLEKSENDWYKNLSDEQQQSVKRGLEQADKGDVITHEEALSILGL